MPLKVKAAIFSEYALKLLANQSDLETGALAIELHSYGAVHMPPDGPQSKSLPTVEHGQVQQLAEIRRCCQS
jgi:hypothetical protein